MAILTRLNINTFIDTLRSIQLTKVPEPKPKPSNRAISSSSFGGSHSGTSGLNHPSPRLPSEVTWLVLDCLIQRFSPYDLDYIIAPPRHGAACRPADRIKSYFGGLRDRTLVCRAWYHITNKYLYAQPTLISALQLRLFRRSLETNPSLGNLVKEIRISDNPLYHRFSFRPFGTQAHQERYAERMREDVQHILMKSRGMESITLHSSSLRFTNSISCVLDEEVVLGDHQIHQLTLIGLGRCRISIASPSFDNLKRLVIQDNEYQPRVRCSFPGLSIAKYTNR